MRLVLMTMTSQDEHDEVVIVLFCYCLRYTEAHVGRGMRVDGRICCLAYATTPQAFCCEREHV